jgi:LuxR family maltose regulon positive regulatory protein
LDAGSYRKLTLVSAPAGYGKTTLISDWVAHSNDQVAWISLEEEDNNFVRFISYLVAALQQIEEGLGSDVQTIIQASQSPQADYLITMLINEIDASQLEFILVLDDYHVISNPEIYDAIDFTLAHLPPGMHLVLIGRVDPPLSLSRLRVGGQITEVRQNDLRFTKTEVSAFINDLMGLNLSGEDISALEIRTEGWIASLQLAALSLQGRDDKQSFVTAFSGSHHYVIDYLVDEVISRQSKEVRTFLSQTSIFSRFCAPLCDAVLKISEIRRILQNIDEANLFLIPLDDERKWYRYHHLFAEFLNQRLQGNEPNSVPKLHRRASIWFEQNGFLAEAIDHALQGEEFTRAAKLVESVGPDMMMRNEFDQLTSWLDVIPKEIEESWPWLCIIRAWMYDRWAQLDIGENYLQHAEAVVDDNTSSNPDEAEKIIRGQIAAIRAVYAIKKGQISQSIEHANQALEYLPEGYFNRGVASFTLGWAKCVQGDLPGAIQEFQEGRRISLAAGNLILAQVIILDIGQTYILQGHLLQAAETFREAIEFKYEKSDIKIPYASSANISLANILREWNELDAAMSHLEEGIEIGIPSKLMDAVAVGYSSIALVYLAQGDLEGATQVCEKAERMVRDIPDLESDTKIKTMSSRVWLLIAQNKLSEAASYVQERGLSADSEINYFAEFRHIIFARVLIYKGRESSAAQELSDAHSILAKILELAKPAGYINQTIEALTLQALAYEAQGKHEKALNSLEEALTLAAPEGYIRTFVDEGELMRDLLRLAFTQNISKDYVSKLLGAFEPHKFKEKLTSQPLVEPLTERELEVLRRLSSELSGPEIALELSISLNTLRTHTKSVFSKLNVNNRRAAVRVAQELSIL